MLTSIKPEDYDFVDLNSDRNFDDFWSTFNFHKNRFSTVVVYHSFQIKTKKVYYPPKKWNFFKSR